MTNDTIDYASYVDAAMRDVVRQILRQVQKTGLPTEHHFFIALRTDFPGVVISETLRSKYPREITIVLQHQFWDLHVDQEQFRVALSFNNIPEKLVVPFAALTGFADPSTKFGLQFHAADKEASTALKPSEPVAAMPEVSGVSSEGEGGKVVALDAFRKK